MPRIPLIEDLTEPIPAGSNILVEFDPASQWYNTSVTITAGWIKSGGLASYNAYSHTPEDIRLQLRRLGLDTEGLEKKDSLRILDWYAIQLGQKSQEKYAMDSLKVADLSIRFSRNMIPVTGSMFPGTGYRLGPDVLRIGDDELVILRYNDEKSYVDYWRTRETPVASARKSTCIYGAVKGVFSESLYRSLEASVDGIIDLRIDEEGGEMKNRMRIRTMRNARYDSRWHNLKIGEKFEVTLEK